MEALQSVMLFLSQLRTTLAPFLTQGTSTLEPLILANPWPFLFGSFVATVVLITAFRALRGAIMRLILLPFSLVTSYLVYRSTAMIGSTILPLIEKKLTGLF